MLLKGNCEATSYSICVLVSIFFVTDSCTFCVYLEMVEKADFNVEDQINYEAETGEGSEGEVFAMLNYS